MDTLTILALWLAEHLGFTAIAIAYGLANILMLLAFSLIARQADKSDN